VGRLAEKIRNTDPGCVALLLGPAIDYRVDKDSRGALMAHSPTSFQPIWEPGFVIKYRSFFDYGPCSYDGDHVIHVHRLTDERYAVDFWSDTKVKFGEAERAREPMRLGRITVAPGDRLGKAPIEPDSTTLRDLAGIGDQLAARGVLPRRDNRLQFTYEGIAQEIGALVCQLGYTLTLLTCKNINLREQISAPRAKRAGGSNKRQVDSYWVLDIPGAPNYWQTVPGAGDEKRLHIVRGHFKTYTEEAPLFGRTVGIIWVPCHARGNAALGIVEKDYSLVEARA
jgi:hypothetical protein